MLGSLDYKTDGADRLEIGVFGSDAPKADGHNNLSGDSNLPLRRFIPDEGDVYDSAIQDLVSEAIAAYKGDNLTIKASDLEEIGTKKELYAELEALFGPYTQAELKRFALGSELKFLLDDYNLLDLL
jgi:hypothetical protein